MGSSKQDVGEKQNISRLIGSFTLSLEDKASHCFPPFNILCTMWTALANWLSSSSCWIAIAETRLLLRAPSPRWAWWSCWRWAWWWDDSCFVPALRKRKEKKTILRKMLIVNGESFLSFAKELRTLFPKANWIWRLILYLTRQNRKQRVCVCVECCRTRFPNVKVLEGLAVTGKDVREVELCSHRSRHQWHSHRQNVPKILWGAKLCQ